jgi:hypothetical protein
MMTTPRPRVVMVDSGSDMVPMSALIAEPEHDPRAVVVALHGGASTAAYFDCPGHPRLSLLRLGAALGFTMVALDRPGYGSSAAYPDAIARPEQRVALAYGAELLGLALAGTGLRYHDAALDILRNASATHRPPGLRALLWEPADLYPADVLSGITNSSTGAPYEADMVRDWPHRDFPVLAAQVRVPIQFSHADHERVWRSDPDALAEIGAAFTAAPRFVADEVVGAGHNLSLGLRAAAYHLRVLSFVEECVVNVEVARESRSAGIEVEAG